MGVIRVSSYHSQSAKELTLAVLRIFVPFVFVLIGTLASAQSEVGTLVEPAVYEIGDMFKEADIVALVKITSGDTENYDHTVYKGEVLQSFKGLSRGAIVYFGPFVGEKLGWDYILFLTNVTKPVAPKTSLTASYGIISYSKVFDEGYSSMETSYSCVFDGKEISKKCDEGVRVCTDYVKLPKSTPAFPPEENDPPFGCRWVRKTVFFSLLSSLAGPKK